MNRRSELLSNCRHSRKFLLSTFYIILNHVLIYVYTFMLLIAGLTFLFYFDRQNF